MRSPPIGPASDAPSSLSTIRIREPRTCSICKFEVLKYSLCSPAEHERALLSPLQVFSVSTGWGSCWLNKILSDQFRKLRAQCRRLLPRQFFQITNPHWPFIREDAQQLIVCAQLLERIVFLYQSISIESSLSQDPDHLQIVQRRFELIRIDAERFVQIVHIHFFITPQHSKDRPFYSGKILSIFSLDPFIDL